MDLEIYSGNELAFNEQIEENNYVLVDYSVPGMHRSIHLIDESTEFGPGNTLHKIIGNNARRFDGEDLYNDGFKYTVDGPATIITEFTSELENSDYLSLTVNAIIKKQEFECTISFDKEQEELYSSMVDEFNEDHNPGMLYSLLYTVMKDEKANVSNVKQTEEINPEKIGEIYFAIRNK